MPAPAPDAPLVVALGGNAIVRRGEAGTIEQQEAHAAAALAPVADLIADGARVVLTHGNGPVVGNILERGEAARDRIPPMPVWIADADSQGGIGSMLQLVLRDLCARRGCASDVVTLVTHVVVDRADPAFARPTKPIGPWYARERAEALSAEEGWAFREVPGRGWRRVVPSPAPLAIVEADSVASLSASGHTVIAAGGGGIPVERLADGSLRGVDAVIDKDATAALLARTLRASALAILMEADAVYAGFGTPGARPLATLTAEEAAAMSASDEFEPGSISPKLAAAAAFARGGGEAVICSGERLAAALRGEAGTRVYG